MTSWAIFLFWQGALLGGSFFTLYMAISYKRMAEEQKDWLLLRIESEMGPVWMARWKHLDHDQLWMQFTYDMSRPSK